VKKGALVYCLGGLVIGLISGFLIANAVSRTVPVPIPTQTPAATNNRQTKNAAERLSREEIKAAFASAEERKEDAAFQKNLALALYRYAKVQNDSGFLPELQNLLEHVNQQTKSTDFEVLTALADCYFTEGQEKSNASLIDKSQDFYREAVRLNPANTDAKIALASTYLFTKPAQPEKAVRELNSILKQNPKNEAALQVIVLALIQSKKDGEAAQRLSELKEVNPDNPVTADLEAQLAQKKIASQK
jgi:predicted Zn-dependent protease